MKSLTAYGIVKFKLCYSIPKKVTFLVGVKKVACVLAQETAIIIAIILSNCVK